MHASSFRYLLEKENYVVFEAGDGKAGLKLIEQVSPELVITDVFMPIMNGLQLIEELSQNKSVKSKSGTTRGITTT